MQFITILKKECRQHFPLTVAMLLLCFLLQLSSFTLTLFGIATTPPVVIALFATVLYAGSATSVSFSIEHEEKTFGFLRNLPVSPLAIILGKVLWVILGTIFFLAGSQVLGFFFWTLMNSFSGNSDWQIFLCIYIIEIIVWGFFWSTLCRKQIHAVIATFASNTLMLYGYIYIIDFIYKVQTDPIFNTKFILIRLIMTIVVGIAAVYLMLQWFKETIRQKITSNFPQCEKVTFYHLYLPTTPFMTLLYQSVWQSLILLLVGVVVTVVACLSIVAIIFSADNIYTVILWFGLLFFVLLSGACTFGADQRNQSFRFLSRCGISARKIWWSRVLPFAIVFLPIMVTAIIIEFVCFSQKVKYGILNFNDFIFIISLTISLWMIPFSVGTFCSIYCRSMIVSVALTIPVSLIFLLWMVLGWFLCRFNPLWTTLPLTVTVLIASRLRVTDWLRELQTWKSLLKPLIPFFITVIIILLAIPFVRIYSVPYVSLDEVKNMLDKIPLADRLNPEERQKLFQETSAKLTQKITKNEIEQINDWEKRMFHYNNFIYHKISRNTNDYTDEHMKRYLKKQCSELKETIKSIPLFETCLLYDYEIKMRIINGGLEYIRLPNSDGIIEKNIITRCRYLPWEKARILRRFNQELRSQLYRSCTDWTFCPFYDKEAEKREQKKSAKELFWVGTFDQLPLGWFSQEPYFRVVNSLHLSLVHNALHLWYLEHDYTLPESLDELLGNYLDEIPHDPLSGKTMKYYLLPSSGSLSEVQDVQTTQTVETNNQQFDKDKTNKDKTGRCLLESGITTIEIQFQTTQSNIIFLPQCRNQ